MHLVLDNNEVSAINISFSGPLYGMRSIDRSCQIEHVVGVVRAATGYRTSSVVTLWFRVVKYPPPRDIATDSVVCVLKFIRDHYE